MIVASNQMRHGDALFEFGKRVSASLVDHELGGGAN